jgi:RimJ/RimL family protein N-acetyltransferase
MVSQAFEVFDVAKIWAHADPRDIGWVRVLEKTRHAARGFLCRHLVHRGEQAYRVNYALLLSEFDPHPGASAELWSTSWK